MVSTNDELARHISPIRIQIPLLEKQNSVSISHWQYILSSAVNVSINRSVKTYVHEISSMYTFPFPGGKL